MWHENLPRPTRGTGMKNPFARFDREQLRTSFISGKPVPHIVIDDFIHDASAKSVLATYPDFDLRWSLVEPLKPSMNVRRFKYRTSRTSRVRSRN